MKVETFPSKHYKIKFFDNNHSVIKKAQKYYSKKISQGLLKEVYFRIKKKNISGQNIISEFLGLIVSVKGCITFSKNKVKFLFYKSNQILESSKINIYYL